MNGFPLKEVHNLLRNGSILKYSDVEERLNKLKKLEKATITHRKSVQEALFNDLGKPDSEADVTEILPVLKEIRHARGKLSTWTKPHKVEKSIIHLNASSYIYYQPKGCVLILSPWNYPFNLCISPLVSAIAAGNTVVLKPSEFTPSVNEVTESIVRECFSPSEVIVVQGGPETARELTEMPFNHIFFTGSPAVGRKVMEAASANLCSVTLELGGKSPCIIDVHADLEKSARRVAWGKFTNCGQTCIAPDLVYVHKSVRHTFLKLLKDEILKRYPDCFEDSSTEHTYGKIISTQHYDRIAALLKEARESGASIHVEGKQVRSSLHFGPTILEPASANEKLAILEEEIFGPLLPVLTWENEQQLFEMLNPLSRPLACYLFTKNKQFETKCRRLISTGALVINDTLSHFAHPGLPFGGIQTSGTGRAHGFHGFKTFSNELAVLKSKGGPAAAELLGSPYSKFKKYLIEKAVKYL